jgi:hypothetical protein
MPTRPRPKKVQKVRYEFQFYEDQAAGVDHMFRAYARQTGIRDQSELFMHILTEVTRFSGAEEKEVDDIIARALSELLAKGLRLPKDHPSYADYMRQSLEAKLAKSQTAPNASH